MLKLNPFWKQLGDRLTPTDRFSLLLTCSLSIAVTGFVAPSMAQVPEYFQTQPSRQARREEIGWEFLGSQELNRGSVTKVEYIGDCPGSSFFVDAEAKFTSTRTPPAPGRRVIIRNVTRGLVSSPYPYTDREYDKGRSSESTHLLFGTRHSGKNLIVLEGENIFEYEIRQGNRVIDSGSFRAVVDQKLNSYQRDAVASQEKICMNSAVALNQCEDLRVRTQYKCSDGRIVRSFLEPTVYSPNFDGKVDHSDFDENFYRMAYPDVDAAILQGRIRSARDHYRKFGRFEGRFPKFNEASYLSKNPDVAQAVRRGKFRSG